MLTITDSKLWWSKKFAFQTVAIRSNLIVWYFKQVSFTINLNQPYLMTGFGIRKRKKTCALTLCVCMRACMYLCFVLSWYYMTTVRESNISQVVSFLSSHLWKTWSTNGKYYIARKQVKGNDRKGNQPPKIFLNELSLI